MKPSYDSTVIAGRKPDGLDLNLLLCLGYFDIFIPLQLIFFFFFVIIILFFFLQLIYNIQKTLKMKHRIKQYVDQYHDMLCIELDNESETHLFRHASEITKETKGGYLKGQIIIPNSSKPCYLRLSLVPSEPDLQNNPFHLHPNLLHLNLRQNKKNRNLKVSNFW